MNKKIQLLKNRQDEIFLSMSGILGGMSAPVRIKLIHFLSQAPLTVEVLAQKIGQSVANTSMHLRKMLNENIVTVMAEGQKRIYSLHPAVLNFWEACQDFVQQIDPGLKLESNENREDLTWDKDLQTTLRMVKKKEILLLDVRPDDEVVEEIPELNILHITYGNLQKSLARIPKRKPVVVFCRGRLCAMSLLAVKQLHAEGVKAYRLKESWFAIKEMWNAERCSNSKS